MGSVSRRALDVSAEMPGKGWYFDLKVWEKDHRDHKGTPMTSCIPQVAGLNAALKMIEDRGGREWYFDLYRKRNKMIRSGVEEAGLSTYP